MAEEREGKKKQKETPAAKAQVLIVMIVADASQLDRLITGMLDIGLRATVVEAKGLTDLLREEMPMFGGLASLLPDASGSRVIFSL